jgi:hypothetical protein
VFRDQIVVVAAPTGGGEVPAGSVIEIGVRGIVADSVFLDEPMQPGDSFTLPLVEQVIYESEVVLALVDPNNLITESDEANNGLARPLEPDVVPDIAIMGVAAVGDNQYLAVDLANTTEVPVRQVAPNERVTLRVFRCDGEAPVDATTLQVDLGPLAPLRVEFPLVGLVRGVCVRVEMDVENFPDASPANNVFQGVVP